MKNTDAAWAAGIIDGEGCISIACSRNGRKFALSVQVGMTHLPTLERLQSLFGGTIRPQTVQQAHWKPRNLWQANSNVAGDVLRKVLPYMTTKAEEARVALEFLALPRARGSQRVSDEMIADRVGFRTRLQELKRS